MINEELFNILERLQVGDQALLNAHDEVLNLFSVMLSETLNKAEEKADKIDEIQDPSGMEAVGFSNGADWVVEKLRDKLHSA